LLRLTGKGARNVLVGAVVGGVLLVGGAGEKTPKRRPMPLPQPAKEPAWLKDFLEEASQAARPISAGT